jgi:hypothetical protein
VVEIDGYRAVGDSRGTGARASRRLLLEIEGREYLAL